MLAKAVFLFHKEIRTFHNKFNPLILSYLCYMTSFISNDIGAIRRAKIKNWSENFSRTSGAQKKGFANFSPAAGFFRCGGTENR